MIQTREWQTGSDYSEIKELDQVPWYQNKTWHMTSEADIYWLKCKITFLYLLNIIQASCKHFASLTSISVGSCEHRHVSWEHQLLHVFHQQNYTEHRNTDLQLPAKQVFLNESITLPVAEPSDSTSAHGLTGTAAPDMLNTDTVQVQPSSLLLTISCHKERRFPMPRVHPVFMPLGIPLMISVFLLHKR